MRTREVEIGMILGERGGKFPSMKEGMFSFLGHLCSAKPDSGLMPDGTGKAVPGKLEGEVNPDLALASTAGWSQRPDWGEASEALDRTCPFMTGARGSSSLAGIAQQKGI